MENHNYKTHSGYLSYIASEAWRIRRRQFLYNHSTCFQCGLTAEQAREAYDQGLHVHHKNYERVGCELDSDLEVLCRRCHEIESFGFSKLKAAHLSVEDWATIRSLIGGELPDTKMTPYGLAGMFPDTL